MRRSLALALLLATSLAGCGGAEHARVDPELMLDQATASGISNASVETDASLRVLGVDRLAQPLRLRLDGPYLSNGTERIPSFDWRLSASALGFPVGGKVLSTGDNVYLTLYGNDYEVGSSAVAAANQRIQQASAAAGSPREGGCGAGSARPESLGMTVPVGRTASGSRPGCDPIRPPAAWRRSRPPWGSPSRPRSPAGRPRASATTTVASTNSSSTP